MEAARTDVATAGSDAVGGATSAGEDARASLPPIPACRLLLGALTRAFQPSAAPTDRAMRPARAENGTAAPRAEPSAPPPVATAAAAASAPAANGKPGGSGTGQSDSSTGGSKRKRGRPRKYEDLTEEERKQRRAMDNRHAAKRSYYRRINKMAELEQVRTTTQLCPLSAITPPPPPPPPPPSPPSPPPRWLAPPFGPVAWRCSRRCLSSGILLTACRSCTGE